MFMKRFLFMFCAVFTVACIFFIEPIYANSRQISTSGGNRSTTWVDISLDGTYKILGLSAGDVLGRPTGTLSEFAAAMEHVSGTDTIIFPVNYFYAYGGPNANQIIGSIMSNRQIVNHSYFDQAIGFRGSNNMFFFELYRRDGAAIRVDPLYYPHQTFASLGYSPVTSFLAYPRLIRNSINLPVQDMPGATLEWQNRRVQRAFMGQRLDGTFVVGNVSGANIREVQDVASYFNLATAVNIDGGASAGIWRNGTYITRPGRQLASVMFITNSRYGVTLNGLPLAMDAYVQNVNGRYMLPLGAALGALGFDPQFDSQENTLSIVRGGREVTYFIGTFFKHVDGELYTLSDASMPGGSGPAGSKHAMAPLQLIADIAGISVSTFTEARSVAFTGTILNQPIEEEAPLEEEVQLEEGAQPAEVAPSPVQPANLPPAGDILACDACIQIFGYCPCPACPC